MKTAILLFALVGFVLGGTAQAGPQGATPWAVIKCKFADQPQEPFFDPDFIISDDGMAGYWQDVSYGNINLNGSTVTGWYTLPVTLAQAQAFPDIRNNIIDACKAAANDVDFSKYYGAGQDWTMNAVTFFRPPKPRHI